MKTRICDICHKPIIKQDVYCLWKKFWYLSASPDKLDICSTCIDAVKRLSNKMQESSIMEEHYDV